MITITTFLWKGWRPVYDATHVNAWARMVKRHCRGEYRLVCVTDDPKGITECETFPIWKAPDVKRIKRQNSFVRLGLFDQEIGSQIGDRVLQMDLDCVILGDVLDLIGDGTFQAMRGWSAPLNGSMWLTCPGAHQEVWDDIQEREAFLRLIKDRGITGYKMVGSDQVWLSLKFPDAPKWGPEHGVYQFSKAPKPHKRPDARIVFFAGDIKPWSEQCRIIAPDLFEIYQEAYADGRHVQVGHAV